MNRLTDADWGWWPVLFLRPPKEQFMDNRVLLRMTVFFGPIQGLVIFIPFMLARRFPFTLAGNAVALLVGSVLFFAIYKITFAYFWNRRARRLRDDHEILV